MRSITHLPWDTAFFKRQIARLDSVRLQPKTWDVIKRECIRRKVELLYWRVPATQIDPIRLALKEGFDFVGLRVLMNRAVSKADQETILHGITFRQARSSDILRLQKMAAPLFAESRFAVDPRFPRGTHVRFFAEWIRLSVLGRFDERVWMAQTRQSPVGFISVRHMGHSRGAIGLVGVHDTWQGKGVGTSLVTKALAWFSETGVRNVEVATQGSNLAAQRLYAACGFRTIETDLWFHRWFDQMEKHV